MKRSKVDIEYLCRASPAILYTFLTTPACLVRWFCEAVDIQDDIYTFEWEGSEEIAQLVDDIEEERVRFVWEDGEEDEYLEFRMYKSDVTNETIFEVTDFCNKGEESETQDYWNNLMDGLRSATGG